MDYLEIIEKIENECREGSMVVWLGAGASMPSGLPGAQELAKELLTFTALSPEECKRIETTVFGIPNISPGQFPFERFMEVILDAMDEIAQAELLKLFALGRPNSYHRFIAHLAKLGMLKTIITTNFDPHIEASLRDEKLVQGKDFEIFHDPKKFYEID